MKIKVEVFEQLLNLCEVLEAGQREYELAKIFFLENQNMEDALHIAIVNRHRISELATLDKDLIKKFAGKVGFDFVTA
jgi:predicted nucleic acid-binding protein